MQAWIRRTPSFIAALSSGSPPRKDLIVDTSLLDQIRLSRENTWLQMRSILDTAQRHKRDVSSGEQTRYNELETRLDVLDGRMSEVSDDAERNAKADVVRARFAGVGATTTTNSADPDLAHAFRSAIKAKYAEPIEIAPSNRSFYQPGLEQRDLLKTTPTQAMRVSTYDRVVQHLVEQTAVLRAGATVINTTTGEDLQVPKSTAFSTSAITAEGGLITESDPTLGVVTLQAHKYATFFQVSRELADDGNADLLDFIARQAAESLAAAYGPHLITGTGTGQPMGLVTSATTGVTGPTGTSTSFGTQATAGQGTDLLDDLYASLAEPYTLSPAFAFIARNATRNAVRKLKTSTGDLVGNQWLANSPAPWFVDPALAAMGANAKSVLAGDMSRYFVRIAGGLRFERSDNFAFQNDLVSFRAVIRLDAELVDINAVKLFVHSAT